MNAAVAAALIAAALFSVDEREGRESASAGSAGLALLAMYLLLAGASRQMAVKLAFVFVALALTLAIVDWAANNRFEISKRKFNFPRARTYELIRARSRLNRSQILQVNTRWKALAEIYTMHSFAPLSNLKNFVNNC